MIQHHHKCPLWGIFTAAAGDRHRGDLMAATGESLTTLDTRGRRGYLLWALAFPCRAGSLTGHGTWTRNTALGAHRAEGRALARLARYAYARSACAATGPG